METVAHSIMRMATMLRRRLRSLWKMRVFQRLSSLRIIAVSRFERLIRQSARDILALWRARLTETCEPRNVVGIDKLTFDFDRVVHLPIEHLDCSANRIVACSSDCVGLTISNRTIRPTPIVKKDSLEDKMTYLELNGPVTRESSG